MVALDTLNALRNLGFTVEPDLVVSTTAHFYLWKDEAEQLTQRYRELVEAVIETVTKLGVESDNPEHEAITRWACGNIFYFADVPELALPHFEHAVALFLQLGKAITGAGVQVGMIAVLYELGRFAEAESLGAQTAALLAESHDSADLRRLAAAHQHTGIAASYRGYYSKTLQEYHLAFEALAKYASFDSVKADTETAKIMNSMALLHVELGQYDDAEAMFSQAIEKLLRYVGADPKWNVDLARISTNLANLLAQTAEPNQNEHDKLSDAFRQARFWRDRVDIRVAETDLALLDLYEAQWLLKQDRIADIDTHAILYRRDRCLARGIAHAAQLADILLGQIAVKAQDFEAAQQHFARIIAADLSEREVPVELRALAGLWQAIALRGSKQPKAAFDALQDTIALVERTAGALSDNLFRAGYMDDKLLMYQHLAQWQAEDNAQDAFAVIEMAKGRTLLEMLRAAKLETDATTSHSVYERASLYPENLAIWIPDGTLAIAYAVVLGNVWAFLLDNKGRFELRRDLSPCPTFRELDDGLSQISAIRQVDVADVGGIASAHSFAQQRLGKWYRNFIRPLQKVIDQYDSLLIVPDGLLNHLPFNCLFNPTTRKYLIETHAIKLTPSLETWRLLIDRAHQKQGTNGESPLIVGYSSDGELPQAPLEAQAIANHFPRSVCLPEQNATLSAFHAHLDKASWIYLATHGEFVPKKPLNSYVKLADQRLMASDVLALKGHLRARAVVLSACETGRGRLSGNEMMGLIRAFLYAGADAVLSTQWRVGDRAAFHLSEGLVKQLLKTQSWANALISAQRALIDMKQESAQTAHLYAKLSHPYYWGSMMIVGIDAAL